MATIERNYLLKYVELQLLVQPDPNIVRAGLTFFSSDVQTGMRILDSLSKVRRSIGSRNHKTSILNVFGERSYSLEHVYRNDRKLVQTSLLLLEPFNESNGIYARIFFQSFPDSERLAYLSQRFLLETERQGLVMNPSRDIIVRSSFTQTTSAGHLQLVNSEVFEQEDVYSYYDFEVDNRFSSNRFSHWILGLT